MENRIIYNAIKTPDGTILSSKHVHDFVMYKDSKTGKEYGVDGGTQYLRRIGNTNECEDLSVNDDGKHSTRRQYLVWGKNYDKDMNRLPETEWVTIQDMTSDHIEAIIDGGYAANNKFYEDVFKEELKFRKKNK